jgi:hypothetical protein
MNNLGFVELIVILVGIFGTAFWIWMLAECAIKEPNNNEKIVWLIVIAVTHFVGALIYFIVRRPKRISSATPA